MSVEAVFLPEPTYYWSCCFGHEATFPVCPTAKVGWQMCDHAPVLNMIQMPEGYSKPGATTCKKCGAVRSTVRGLPTVTTT